MPETTSPNIAILISKLLTGTLSESETCYLNEWVTADTTGRRAALLKMMLDNDQLTREYRQRTLVDIESALREMQVRISIAQAPVRRKRRTIMAAAASAALLICSSLWYLGRDVSLSEPAAPTAVAVPDDTTSIIRPGITKAVLWQSSGSSMQLRANDPITSGNKFPATRQDICLTSPEELCLEVPRGGEFKIILEDSTEVWLNSESTIRYPEAFGSGERRVAVTGEVYFQVKKDPSRPFYVETDRQVVRVYGTSFNIRAYHDEPATYTTLETGSISLSQSSAPSGELFLSQGHQAILDHTSDRINMSVVDPGVVTSWRHGRFIFENQTLERIMRDLSRWYDFHYEFTDQSLSSRIFMGSIPRYSDFRTVIQVLENCGHIRFTVSPSDNKILISEE